MPASTRHRTPSLRFLSDLDLARHKDKTNTLLKKPLRALVTTLCGMRAIVCQGLLADLMDRRAGEDVTGVAIAAMKTGVHAATANVKTL